MDRLVNLWREIYCFGASKYNVSSSSYFLLLGINDNTLTLLDKVLGNFYVIR
jgi:hypothetical protein